MIPLSLNPIELSLLVTYFAVIIVISLLVGFMCSLVIESIPSTYQYNCMRNDTSDLSKSHGTAMLHAVATGVVISVCFTLINVGHQQQQQQQQKEEEGFMFNKSVVLIAIIIGSCTLMYASRLLYDYSRGSMLAMASLYTVGGSIAMGTIISLYIKEYIQLLAFAMICHNIPKTAMAMASLRITSHMSSLEAFMKILMIVFLPQLPIIIVSYILTHCYPTLSPVTLGISIGMMLYTAFIDLLPCALSVLSMERVSMTLLSSIVMFEAFVLLLDWAANHHVEAAQLWHTLAWSFFAGISTSVGGLITLLYSNIGDRQMSLLLGLAAGVMISVSLLDMIAPNIPIYGVVTTVILFSFGVIIVFALDFIVHRCFIRYSANVETFFSNSIEDKRKGQSAIMTAIALALHNAPEGLAVGLSTMSPTRSSLRVVIAICLHNIPEGIAVAAAVLNATHRYNLAFVIATLTGIVEPFSAVLSVSLLYRFLSNTLLDYALLTVGGIMMTVSCKELVPEACRKHVGSTFLGITIGVTVMCTIIVLLEESEERNLKFIPI